MSRKDETSRGREPVVVVDTGCLKHCLDLIESFAPFYHLGLWLPVDEPQVIQFGEVVMIQYDPVLFPLICNYQVLIGETVEIDAFLVLNQSAQHLPAESLRQCSGSLIWHRTPWVTEEDIQQACTCESDHIFCLALYNKCWGSRLIDLVYTLVPEAAASASDSSRSTPSSAVRCWPTLKTISPPQRVGVLGNRERVWTLPPWHPGWVTEIVSLSNNPRSTPAVFIWPLSVLISICFWRDNCSTRYRRQLPFRCFGRILPRSWRRDEWPVKQCHNRSQVEWPITLWLTDRRSEVSETLITGGSAAETRQCLRHPMIPYHGTNNFPYASGKEQY